MNIKTRNKIKPGGTSMSSMTDIVFLLLICFLLTTSFVTPSIVELDLPSSTSSKVLETNDVRVAIDKNLNYFVNGAKTNKQSLTQAIKATLNDSKQNTIVLAADKTVPVAYFVDVISIGSELNIAISIEVEEK